MLTKKRRSDLPSISRVMLSVPVRFMLPDFELGGVVEEAELFEVVVIFTRAGYLFLLLITLGSVSKLSTFACSHKGEGKRRVMHEHGKRNHPLPSHGLVSKHHLAAAS